MKGRRGLTVLVCIALSASQAIAAIEKACRNKKIDLVYATDISLSISNNELKYVKKAISKINEGFPVIGKNDIQVGAVVFARKMKLVVGLDKTQSSAELRGIQSNFTHRNDNDDAFNRGTNIGGGLSEALKELRKNGRKDSTKIILAITDGKCTKPRILRKALINLNKERHSDIIRIAVGIGRDANHNELNAIATGDGQTNSYLSPSFKYMERLTGLILHQICTVKEQMGSTVECDRICLSHGSVMGNTRRVGSMVMFDCDAGYALEGASNAVCRADGSWSEKAPTCKRVVKCPYMLGLTRGKIRKPRNHNEIGEKIRFQCYNRFLVKGSTEATCQADGQWSHMKPTCKSNFCPTVTISDGDMIGSDTRPGKTVRFKCISDFMIRPGDKTKLRCRDDLTWDNPPPKCIRKSCFPNCIKMKNGYVYVRNGGLEFSCFDGFTLKGTSRITCKDGLMSHEWPSCALSVCKHVPFVRYGNVTYSDDGMTATVTCDKGYRTKGGPVYHCKDGGWGGIQSCYEHKCPIIREFRYGNMSEQSGLVGDTVFFSCNKGYTLSGTSALTCLESRKWSGSKPYCKRVRGTVAERLCPFPAVANGECTDTAMRAVGDTITCSCAPGFEADGATTLTCMSNLKWNKPILRCKAVPCPMVPSTLAATTVVNAQRTSVIYSCLKGYKRKGPREITCTNQIWSPQPPTCEDTRCPYIKSLRFAHLDGRGYKEGVAMKITCKPGFVYEGASRTTVCKDNVWTPEIGRCVRDRCKTKRTIPNGKLRNKEGTYTRGSKITVVCNKGYRAEPIGATHIECLQNRTWTYVKCVYNQCPGLSSIRNGKVYKYSETLGSIVKFRCDAGYNLVGKEQIKCLDNYQWSDPIPSCVAVKRCKTLCPRVGFASYADKLQDSVATFGCPSGKINVGSKTATCKDGSWTSTQPTCVDDPNAVSAAVKVKPPIKSLLKLDDMKTVNACKGKAINLVYLVDNSKSIDDREMQVVRDCVTAIAKATDPAKTDKAMITFDSGAAVTKRIKDYKDTDTFLNGILARNISTIKGGTATDKGIHKLMNEVGSLSGATRALIITDGNPTCSDENLKSAVDKMKKFAEDNDFQSIVVGVGGATKEVQLRKLAIPDGKVTTLARLSKISNEDIKKLAAQICS